jgi:hypothetical protein
MALGPWVSIIWGFAPLNANTLRSDQWAKS